MDLALAGALSGAGNKGAEGLAEVQKYSLQQALEQQRQDNENMRLDKNLAAQRQMHTESIEAHAKEGRLTREQAERLATSHNDLLRELDENREDAAAQQGRLNRQVHRETAKDTLDFHKADAAAKLALEREKMTRDEKIATQTLISKQLTEVGNEITRISRYVEDAEKNVLFDPNKPPAGYLANRERLQRLVQRHDAYTGALHVLSGHDLNPPAQSDRPVLKDPFSKSVSPSVPGKSTFPLPGAMNVTPPSSEYEGLAQTKLPDQY